MKKFYLLMLSLVVAMAANAANWYISGAFQGWAHANANYELKPVEGEAGVFRYTMPEGHKAFAGEFLICQGTPGSPDWNNKIGTNGSKVKEGEAYSYRVGAGNFNMDGSVENAVITLDTNAKTLLVTGAAKENDYTTIYLVGDMGGGWNDSRTDYPLALKEGTQDEWTGTYKLTAAKSYFKMRAGDIQYGTGRTGDIEVVAGETYTTPQTGDSFVLPAGEYIFTFVCAKNAEEGKLTVTVPGGGEIVVTYPETMFVIGNVNGADWGPDNGVAMTKVEDGVYEVKAVEIGSALGTEYGYFSFAVSLGAAWNEMGQRYGALESDTEPSFDSANGITAGENSFKVAGPAKYDMTLSLVDETLTITKSETVIEPTPGLYVPATLYLMGNVGENHWDVTSGIELTKNDKVFTASKVVFDAAGADNVVSYIQFNELRGTASDDWGGVNEGYRYGAPAKDTPIEFAVGATSAEAQLAVYVPNINASACESFAVPAGTYDVAVDFNGEAPMLTLVKVQTGIDAVTAADANAPVEYFNLQGVRVANPATGLFIRRQGSNVSKVYVK
ncbi:MAG: hypothetical protein NC418_06470 [Muribaculaceae bacterium]|nr:hypothetical protein [Muribaculaceae bacterium]